MTLSSSPNGLTCSPIPPSSGAPATVPPNLAQDLETQSGLPSVRLQHSLESLGQLAVGRVGGLGGVEEPPEVGLADGVDLAVVPGQLLQPGTKLTGWGGAG